MSPGLDAAGRSFSGNLQWLAALTAPGSPSSGITLARQAQDTPATPELPAAAGL